MLFPQIGSNIYDQHDDGLLQRMNSFYTDSITINQSFWNEASIDSRFECGDQSIYNDMYGNIPMNRRRQFGFNRIKRVINMISGHQRRCRKSTIVTPVENADSMTADQFTKILMWISTQENVLETLSESFHGSLVTGMNLLQVWVDYRSDPISGNIKVDNCAYNSFLMDPYFKKADLSDCNGIWKRSYLTKRECISLMPDNQDLILGLVGNDIRDGKFVFMPESYNLGSRNLLAYDEFYYRDYRKQQMMLDAQTGETLEWRSNNEEGLKEFLRQYPQVTMIEQEVPTVRLAIVIQGKVAYDGPNPLGIDQYPFVPVFAYYNPQIVEYPWRIQGVVRGLRDAQYLYNRRRVIELDILESQVTSGFIYKPESMINPADIFMSGQGKSFALKQDAQMTDIQSVMAPQVPPSMTQLSELLGKEVQEISGVNEELMGSATDDKAGILSMLRQGAGLTTLQGLFDNLDRSQKLLGRLMIDIIQANFTPGKVKKILEGDEPAPQFYNKAFGKYNADVEEGLNTTTQKQMQLAQLLQLKEVGIPIPDDVILDACTLQNKTKLLESIKQAQQQQQQAQQAQIQSEVQLQQAQAELAHARAAADQGLGLERLSRIEENSALAEERKAQAVKDENAALLDLVRALKEIDGLDIAHIKELVTLQQYIKAQEQGIDNQLEAKKQQRPTKMQPSTPPNPAGLG
jgi:hypothetical protein